MNALKMVYTSSTDTTNPKGTYHNAKLGSASNAKGMGTEQAHAQGKLHAGSAHKNTKPRTAKAKQQNVHNAKAHMLHGTTNAQHVSVRPNEWRL